MSITEEDDEVLNDKMNKIILREFFILNDIPPANCLALIQSYTASLICDADLPFEFYEKLMLEIIAHVKKHWVEPDGKGGMG